MKLDRARVAVSRAGMFERGWQDGAEVQGRQRLAGTDGEEVGESSDNQVEGRPR